MTTDRGALAALLATMAALASATPAIAQTEQTVPVRGLEGLANPQAPSSPTGTAIPIPDAPKIVLPKDGAAPRRAARPRTDQRPADQRPADKRATDRLAAERTTSRVEPETRQADAPVRSSQDTNAPTASAPTSAPIVQQPAPTQIPANDGAPQAVAPQPAAPTAEPVTQPSTVAAPETGRAMPFWLWLLVIVVVVGAVWALRRRKPDAAHARELRETPVPVAKPIIDVEPVAVDEAPRAAPARPVVANAPVAAVEPSAAPVAVAPAAPKFLEPRGKAVTAPLPAARARLTCELRPLRAGLNLLSATVECEMVVTNTGTAPAEGIRAGIALLTAHADQDVDLAAFNAAPVVRPAAAPFALAAGETRTIRTVTAIAREAIRTMTAANRPMFVPVVATNILYVTAGDEAQTARAWVVGIERVDSAKLAPFWLDAPARMYTTVAARPHAVTFDR